LSWFSSTSPGRRFDVEQVRQALILAGRFKLLVAAFVIAPPTDMSAAILDMTTFLARCAWG
jgi:hypothetical protein